MGNKFQSKPFKRLKNFFFKIKKNWREKPKKKLHYALELLFKEVEAFFDIFEIFSSGEDDFTWREKERNDLGVLDPVDKARELLGFVFDILEV